MSDLLAWTMKTKWARSLLFTGFLWLLVKGLGFVPQVKDFEYTALNFAYSMREEQPINEDIAFWNITDDDIEMSRWPWGWDRFAHVVKALDDYDAKLGVFQENTFSSPGLPAITEKEMDDKIDRLVENLEDVKALNSILHSDELSPEEELARALASWDHAVLSQYFLIPDIQTIEKVETRKEAFKKEFVAEKRKRIEGLKRLTLPLPGGGESLLSAINVSPIGNAIAPHVKGIGFMRVLPDPDDIIRQIPTLVDFDGRITFSLPIIAAAAYYECPLEDIVVTPGESLTFKGIPHPKGGGDLTIPIDASGRMYVNWTTKKQLTAFNQVPFDAIKKLLTWELCRDFLRELPLDFENLNGLNPILVKFDSFFRSKVAPLGWLKPGELGRVYHEARITWVFQNGIQNGVEMSDLIDELLVAMETELEKFDLEMIYTSIYMNTALAVAWEDLKGAPSSYEEWRDNEDYGFQINRILYQVYEARFSQELRDQWAEAGLVAIDENFGCDADERVVVLGLEKDPNTYISDLAIQLDMTADSVKASKLFELYDFMKSREETLRNGFDHTIHFLNKGMDLESISPLYFREPFSFNSKEGSEKITLLKYKDKTVFIGLTATGLNALSPTPYVGRYPMASLVPTAFNTIVTGSFIRRLEWLGPLLSLVYILIVLLMVFYLPAFVSSPAMLLMALGHFFLGTQLLDEAGIISQLVTPILAILSAYIAANIHIYIEQKKERQKIRGMFAAMVSPEVLKIMEEEPDKFNLRGEKVEASMFSSDVSGFTSISEGVTAQELALILNLYLTPMSNLVMIYGGYVEKYEGDAIKADFGMPLPDNDHAWKACFSALLQQEEITVVQRMLQLKYGVMITARMGVNTGVVNAGNMGSEKKMQYCAIGEEVAMAEELEPSNKMWETWIAISPETLRLSGDRFKTRLLDVVEYEYVTIPVYELLAWDADVFMEFWTGKPIPALVIEGWERIISEKVLAYLDYYHEHRSEGNAFYELMLESFEALEQLCLDSMMTNDRIELVDMERRYQKLLEDVDAQGVVVPVAELDLVDAKELELLQAALESSEEAWLRLLNEHLYELKRRTHSVGKITERGGVDQLQLDEWNTAIDTLEKNCNCYIKRNRFPREGDNYGMYLKAHLVKILPEPLQGLSDEELKTLDEERTGQVQKLKQAMLAFIEKAKPLAEDYQKFMAGHCVMDEKKAEVCEIFAKGRELYLDRRWDEAMAEFEKGLAIVEDDGPCLKFIERCETFKKSPPEEDWDGTWEADW